MKSWIAFLLLVLFASAAVGQSVKLSELPVTTTASSTDPFLLNHAGVTSTITLDNLAKSLPTWPSSSVANEIVLFSGTDGHTVKRATGTGIAKLTSGKLSPASANIDYNVDISTDVPNGDYTWPDGVSTAVQSAPLTANHTLTLPKANTFAPGRPIMYVDAMTGDNFGMEVFAALGDTLNEGSGSVLLFKGGGANGGCQVARFMSDGVGNWTLLDSNSSIVELQKPTDRTARAVFDLDGIPTGTVRTVSIAGDNDSTTVIYGESPGSTYFVKDINADGHIVYAIPAGGGGGGGTTTGNNILNVPDPGAITWLRINADNSVSTRSATETLTDLGVYNSLSLHGTAGAGYIELPNQSSAPGTPTSSGRIYFDNTNRLSWIGSNGFTRTFDGTALTTSRVYTLPDSTGTVLLNSTATTLGYNLFTLPNGGSQISFIRVNPNNTVNLRTVANLRSDLAIDLVENTALSTWAGSSNITQVGVLTGGTIPSGLLQLTDETLNNTSTSAHGLAPKLSGDSNTFLNGTGTFSTPTTNAGSVTSFTDSGNFVLTGVISPSTLTGNQDNWSPTGLATASVIRIDGGTSDRIITGLVAQSGGTILTLINVGTTNGISLTSQGLTSTAANRFLFGSDVNLNPGNAITVWYDSTTSRWRPIGRVLGNTGVTSGSYGDATHVPAYTVSKDGRISNATNLLIQLAQSQVTGLATTDRAAFANVVLTHSTLTYAATTNIDFDSDGFKTLTLTGDVTFTSSNLAAGRSKTIRIVGDSSTRNLTFPGGWTFIGAAAPTTLAANKTAILSLVSFGTADSDVIAEYVAQP